MVGFGIYVVSQKIILLPIIAKQVNDNVYTSLTLFMSILNIFCNVTGGELGNVRLIKNNDYKDKKVIGDFSRILLVLSLLIIVIGSPILIFLKYEYKYILFFILTILMANIRLYATNFYRLEKKFLKVIIQNLIYLIGIILGLFVFNYIHEIYIILFIPELISIIYALFNCDLIKMGLNKTTEIKSTIKKYIGLGTISLLNNIMNYCDSILIYPILGAQQVAVYYAVNSVSNITSLLTNPMSSVILSWISNAKDEKKNKIFKITLSINIPLIIIVTLITIPLTYLSMFVLYKQYLSGITILVILISISTAFGTAGAFTKTILIKYTKTANLVGIYIMYFIVLSILGIILSKIYSLIRICFCYRNI
jgi:membrane protein